MLLDKRVDSKSLLCKTRSPWTHSILLIVEERWMPKQIAIIDLRGLLCADSTNFFGVSLLNCSFRSESRVTHALCFRIFMASLCWNRVHSTHCFQNNGNINWLFLYIEVVWVTTSCRTVVWHYDLTSDRIHVKPALHSWDERKGRCVRL